MTFPAWSYALPDEGRLVELAQIMRQNLQAPLVMYLQGELGAGKTTFARALIHALGYSGRVKSPSYGLLESYAAGGFSILHLDLYRIESPAELEYLAIRDLFNKNSLLLVEWSEKGAGLLAPADVELHFGETAGQRFVQLIPRSMAGASLAQATQRQCEEKPFPGKP